MNGSKTDTEAVKSARIGRRALKNRHEAYREERWRVLQVIMPE
jgi:hypothetical protein